MLKVLLTLPLAMAMPAVDHKAERQAMVRSYFFSLTRSNSALASLAHK